MTFVKGFFLNSFRFAATSKGKYRDCPRAQLSPSPVTTRPADGACAPPDASALTRRRHPEPTVSFGTLLVWHSLRGHTDVFFTNCDVVQNAIAALKSPPCSASSPLPSSLMGLLRGFTSISFSFEMNISAGSTPRDPPFVPSLVSVTS